MASNTLTHHQSRLKSCGYVIKGMQPPTTKRTRQRRVPTFSLRMNARIESAPIPFLLSMSVSVVRQ